MAATFLRTTQRTLGTTLADVAPEGDAAATPTGKVRTATIRFANIHASADATADVYVVDTSVAANANDNYRARNYPVPFSTTGSAPDMERTVVLVAGQKLQFRASAASSVAVSIEWVQDDA